MENPLDQPLRVKLEVDAKTASNWYEGKWAIFNNLRLCTYNIF